MNGLSFFSVLHGLEGSGGAETPLNFASSCCFMRPTSREATVGSPAGISIRSCSNQRIFSASALILLSLEPYARSAW